MKQGQPFGYVIVDIREVRDADLYSAYRARVGASFEAAAGTYLVRGGDPQTLWGNWQASRIVIARFPTASAASAWWDSPRYRPIRRLRERATRSRFLVAEGIPKQPDIAAAGGLILFDVREDIEPETYAEFRAAAAETVALLEGRYLVRGGAVRVHEGDWRPQRLVLVAFASRTRARAWWSHLGDSGLLALLDRSTRGDALLLSGIEEA